MASPCDTQEEQARLWAEFAETSGTRLCAAGELAGKLREAGR